MSPDTLGKYWLLYYTGLVKYAESIVGITEVGEDIVSDIFLNVQRLYGDDDAVNKNYFLGAVRIRCYDYLRKQKRRRKQHNLISYAWDQQDGDLFLVEAYTVQLIYDQIELLPEGPKTVISLCFAGLTFREIADRLNIAPQTVLNQKTKAVNKLKAFVHNHKLL